jgi:hypothetical protein
MRSPSFPLAEGALALPAATAEGRSRQGSGSAAAKCRSDGAPSPAPRQGGWLARLDDWFARQRALDRDAWLAGAKDAFESEARNRDLGRNTPTRYY